MDEKRKESGEIQSNFLPKYAWIKQKITEEIRSGRLTPGSRVPSEAEIMKRYGVGRMTAHRALRLVAEEGLVVRVQGHGTYVAEHPAPALKAVEFVYCGRRMGIYTGLLAGIESRAHELGFTLVLSGTDWDLKRALEHAERADAKKVYGVIYRPLESSTEYDLNREVVRRYRDHRIPIVCVDSRVGLGEEESYVVSDNFAKARELTLELVRAGYRRIGFIAAPESSTVRDRLAGYRQALEESGLKFDRKLVYEVDVRQPKGKQVDEAVERVLSEFVKTGRMDSMFCICDYTALAMLSVCRRKFPELAQTFAIVGYDDLEFAHDLELTTVRQPLRDEGRIAIDCLNRLMKGEKGPFQIVLPGTVVRRKLIGHLSAQLEEGETEAAPARESKDAVTV